MHIETGWENALEAALRERLSALEVSRLEMVRAFIAAGHEVMIAARDLGKTLGVIRALEQEVPGARLHGVALDLADFDSIVAVAAGAGGLSVLK